MFQFQEGKNLQNMINVDLRIDETEMTEFGPKNIAATYIYSSIKLNVKYKSRGF